MPKNWVLHTLFSGNVIGFPSGSDDYFFQLSLLAGEGS